MKRKNIFVMITITVILLAILLVYFLLRSSSKLNDKHISINFDIHNCSALAPNVELFRNEFIKPLLIHTVITEKNGLENLYLTKVSCDNISFSIPVIGINSFRYKNEAFSLKETLMISESRKKDEESFFNNWRADGYSELEKILIKGHPKHKDNDSLAYLWQIVKSESDELIPDSVIIDKTCLKEQRPYLFSSTANFRKFIDEKLKINKNAIFENGKTGQIKIFIWCGEGYTDDQNNDGPIASTTITETEGKGIDTISIIKKETEVYKRVTLGTDRKFTWEGEASTIKIKLSIPTLGISIVKTVYKNQKIGLSNEEKEQLLQVDDPKIDKISIQYLNPNTNKYSGVNVVGSNGFIHCYNIF